MSQRTRSVPVRPRTAVDAVTSGLQRLAFWAAVLLPAAYVPLLSSPLGQQQLLVLGGLLALNVGCLLLGHDYSP